MPYSIALAGKGGTGKTTVAGMLIKYLVKKHKTPVLAVDADSNANLNEVLGLTVSDTVGNAREEMKKGQVPSGMTKDVFISMKLEQAVVEVDGYDLIVMGQPEGQGCYCAANSLLTGFLERLTGNYPYMVMDNEAGMEHISRLTTHDVDLLLLVSDTSRRGLQAAKRIKDLSKAETSARKSEITTTIPRFFTTSTSRSIAAVTSVPTPPTGCPKTRMINGRCPVLCLAGM